MKTQLKSLDFDSALNEARQIYKPSRVSNWVSRSLTLDHRRIQLREKYKHQIPQFLNQLLLLPPRLLTERIICMPQSTVVVLFLTDRYKAVEVGNQPPKELFYDIPVQYSYLYILFRAFHHVVQQYLLKSLSAFQILRMVVPGKSVFLDLQELTEEEIIYICKTAEYFFLKTKPDVAYSGLSNGRSYLYAGQDLPAVKFYSSLPQTWAGTGNINAPITSRAFNFSSQFFIQQEDIKKVFKEGIMFRAQSCSYYYLREELFAKSCGFQSVVTRGPSYVTITHRMSQCPFRIQIIKDGVQLVNYKRKVRSSQMSCCLKEPGEYTLRLKANWTDGEAGFYYLEMLSDKQVKFSIRKLNKPVKYKFYTDLFQQIYSQRVMFTTNLAPQVKINFVDLSKEFGYFLLRTQAKQDSQTYAALVVDQTQLYQQGFEVKFPYKAKKGVVRQLVERLSYMILRPRKELKEVVFPPKEGIRYFLTRAQLKSVSVR